MTSEISLLKPLGYQTNTTCGYCKRSAEHSSYYLSCDKMRVDHYQTLMDRGWRRSGTLYYKPDLTRSCCPHYTIRLRASSFVPKREQRQAVNRWNRFVIGSDYKRKAAQLYPQSREEKRVTRDKFDLCHVVHSVEYSNIPRPTGRKSQKPIEPAHKFEVTLESDAFSKEKYDVFLRYQLQIHKDPASRWKPSDFKRFLCSGLERKIWKTDGKTQKLGSYHQCYWLDGKLVAVGVLDLLPHAVSSVYLFYDPEHGAWDFGKMSALREIQLTIEGGYNFYYMGYYIHSCVKMRYKGKYSPTYMLDPVNLEWNLFDERYREQLDIHKYYAPSRSKAVSITANSTTNLDAIQTASGRNRNEKADDSANSSSTTKERSTMFADEKDLDFDSEDSDIDDTNIPEGSLFEYNIPGVLTRKEVSQLDLAHWKLVVRNALVDLEDLVHWEKGRIDDPGSIKGIAAELIAATGPSLLQDSALVLF